MSDFNLDWLEELDAGEQFVGGSLTTRDMETIISQGHIGGHSRLYEVENVLPEGDNDD